MTYRACPAPLQILVATCLLAASACSKDKGGDSGPGAATETTTTTGEAVAGSGTVVVAVAPKDGAPAESVAGATVQVTGHPELTATTDATGNAEIVAVPPGTVSLIITSAPPTALTAGASAYGLKVDDVLVKPSETNDLGSLPLKETGALTGIVDFFANPNDLDLTGSDAFVPGTSFLVKTDDGGRFALEGLPEGTYQVRIQHTGFAVLDLTVEIREGETTDIGKVLLSLSKGPEGSIAIVPDSTPTIGGEATPLVTSRSVSANLTFDGEAALMRVSDEPSFLSKAWEPVQSTVDWTFTSDGTKSLYVMFSDLNGLESAPFATTFVVDTEAPTISAVKILNGWGQTASRNVPVEVVAADTGSGIKEVAFANGSSFATTTWVTYDTSLAWQLASGLGSKQIVAKVRDFADRESALESAVITLGNVTVIAALDYDRDLTLASAQSPYLISDGVDVVVEADLTLEPGVVLKLEGESSLDVRGVFSAAGTAGNHVTIQAPDLTPIACSNSADGYATLRLDGGLPGVSAANVIRYTDFKRLSRVVLNGGTVTHSDFSGVCSSGGNGMLEKRGLDPLTFTDNSWTAWGVGMKAVGGTANTVVRNNTGSVVTALYLDGAEGVAFDTMSLTAIPLSGNALFVFDSGTATTGGLTFSGDSSTLFRVESSASFTLDDVTVNTCDTMFQNYGSGTFTLNDSTIASCDYGIKISGTTDKVGPIRINQSTLLVAQALIHQQFDSGSTTGVSASVTIADSDLTCGYPGPTTSCDLYFGKNTMSNMSGATFGSTELTLTDNNIHCPDNRCIGFGYENFGATGSTNGAIDLDLTGNFWADKTNGLKPSLLTSRDSNYDPMSISATDWVIAEDSAHLTWTGTIGSQAGSAIATAGDQ